MSGEAEVIRSIWRSRTLLLSAFGLVGAGAVIGAGSVYIFFLRKKLQDIFKIQSALSSQIQSLKKEVDKVNENLENGSATELGDAGSETLVKRKPSLKSAHAASGSRGSRVRFRDGYETADEDEYVTASSDSEGEHHAKAHDKNADNLDIPAGAASWIVDFLKDCDKLLDGDSTSQHEAYIRLQSYKDKLDHLCGFWWRFAKATHMEASAASAVGDKEMKRSLTLSGCSRAEKALSLNESSANAHKWYAITLGSKGDYVSINEKIKNGFTFKEHVDKAVKINPKDPSLHYLLGRFCLEVSQLGWMERKVASTLFSSPPSATPEEALNHFKASESLGKPLKDNRLYMAKCYIVLKNNENAAHWLKKAVDMPNISSSDHPIHEEAVKLFSKYRSYLK